MSSSVRFQSRMWNHFAIRPVKTLCLRAVFYHHKTCLSCNKSTVCKKDQVVLKYALLEKDCKKVLKKKTHSPDTS